MGQGKCSLKKKTNLACASSRSFLSPSLVSSSPALLCSLASSPSLCDASDGTRSLFTLAIVACLAAHIHTWSIKMWVQAWHTLPSMCKSSIMLLMLRMMSTLSLKGFFWYRADGKVCKNWRYSMIRPYIFITFENAHLIQEAHRPHKRGYRHAVYLCYSQLWWWTQEQFGICWPTQQLPVVRHVCHFL